MTAKRTTPEPNAAEGPQWSNWFANQTCHPIRLELPRTEAEVQEAVAWAARHGKALRVAAGGHSLSPLVVTEGIIINLGALDRTIASDGAAMKATAPPGVQLLELFEPLWDSGLALQNMGDVATARLGGVIGTGVHGAGVGLPCMSATVSAARLVTAGGELLEVSEEKTPELLRAARISMGMLGVMTEITIDVVPAYNLREQVFFMSVEEALDRWDELVSGHRHFSFFYLPSPKASGVYSFDQLPVAPKDLGESCFGTVRNAVDPDAPAGELRKGEAQDRMYQVFAFEFEPNFRELEYAVPLEEGKAVFRELRGCLRSRTPSYDYPVEVTFVGGDDALLSPYGSAPSAVFSVAEDPDVDWERHLAEIEPVFVEHGGRPHWGKFHSLTAARVSDIYPGATRFREIRRELDPTGVFLNDHLKALFE